MTSDRRQLLRHFLATLAYRGANILRDMPPEIPTFRPHPAVRTPVEILNHVNGVLTYAHAQFKSGDAVRPPLADWDTERQRFFELLQTVDRSLQADLPLTAGVEEKLLQGPLADAMLHLGQIGIFRRMAGSPVPAENDFAAPITAGELRDLV